MDSKQKRQSDPAPSGKFSRSESRLIHRDGRWYFSSREGDMGPFETEAEANEQLDAYVMLIDLKEENERPVTPDLEADEETLI